MASKNQIIEYMIGVLGYREDDELDKEERENLWKQLSEDEKIECIEYCK